MFPNNNNISFKCQSPKENEIKTWQDQRNQPRINCFMKKVEGKKEIIKEKREKKGAMIIYIN